MPSGARLPLNSLSPNADRLAELKTLFPDSLPYTYSGKRMTGNPKPAQMCKPSVRQCSSQIKPI